MDPEGGSVDWPGRVTNYCRFLADKLKGLEMYDMWLRTGHADHHQWTEFLCEGEGVFSDCLEEWGWDKWPMGDSGATLEDLAHELNMEM